MQKSSLLISQTVKSSKRNIYLSIAAYTKWNWRIKKSFPYLLLKAFETLRYDNDAKIYWLIWLNNNKSLVQ